MKANLILHPRRFALCAQLALAGCASLGPLPGSNAGGASAPAAPTPAPRLAPPANTRAALQLHARGAQLFRCERDASGWFWAFREPQAQLLDAAERPVGRHGSGMSFEHADGSRLTAEILAWQDAPGGEGDLKWLLLATRARGAGALAGVSHVQRINTHGGQPLAGCTAAQANQTLRVPFEADFIFFKPR